MSTIDQLSIFLENRAGRLAEVTQTLADADVNILALSLADTSDFGILRLLVNDSEKAKTVLKQKSFTVGANRVIAVELDDQPGVLNDIMQLLSKSNVNVEYMYDYVPRNFQNSGKTVIVFRFDKVDEALALLQSHGKVVVSHDQLCMK